MTGTSYMLTQRLLRHRVCYDRRRRDDGPVGPGRSERHIPASGQSFFQGHHHSERLSHHHTCRHTCPVSVRYVDALSGVHEGALWLRLLHLNEGVHVASMKVLHQEKAARSTHTALHCTALRASLSLAKHRSSFNLR